MAFLNEMYFGNSLQAWLTAAAVAAVVLIILGIVKKLLVGRLSRMAEQTPTDVDDLIVELIGQIRWFFLLMISIYAGSLFLTVPEGLTRVIQSLLVISLLIQGALWGNKIITYWLG